MDFQNGKIVRHTDVIDHIGAHQPLRQSLPHFTFRQHHAVRAYALEHTGMHRALRLSYHIFRAEFLEHYRNQDTRFHIRTYSNDAAVKIARTDRAQHRFVLRVAANRLRHIIRDVLHVFLILVQRKYLLPQRSQFPRQS